MAFLFSLQTLTDLSCRFAIQIKLPSPKWTHAMRPSRAHSASKRLRGAPNVVVVLIDDIGFGATTPFGGAIETPTFDTPGRQWPAFQPLPHHGALFAHPGLPAFWTEPSQRERGFRHGGRNRLSRQPGDATRTMPSTLQRHCVTTDTAPPHSANGTRRRPGKSPFPARTSAGRRTPDSTSSTASSAARPTSGSPSSLTA